MATDLEYLQKLDNPENRTRSLIDLIEVQTVDLELAAFFASHVWRGASYITGSGPGGIGKTTTMNALLSFVGANLPFVTALPGEVSSIGATKSCVISNELSDHPPPTYLWGDDLRAFFALGDAGHTLVSNVHADNLDEIHHQIVEINQVPEEQFHAINLLIFICLEGGNPPQRRIKDNTTRRIISKIYYSDGKEEHRLIYDPQKGLLDHASRNEEREQNCRTFLAEMIAGKERRLAEVRRRFLQWYEA